MNNHQNHLFIAMSENTMQAVCFPLASVGRSHGKSARVKTASALITPTNVRLLHQALAEVKQEQDRAAFHHWEETARKHKQSSYVVDK